MIKAAVCISTFAVVARGSPTVEVLLKAPAKPFPQVKIYNAKN